MDILKFLNMNMLPVIIVVFKHSDFTYLVWVKHWPNVSLISQTWKPLTMFSLKVLKVNAFLLFLSVLVNGWRSRASLHGQRSAVRSRRWWRWQPRTLRSWGAQWSWWTSANRRWDCDRVLLTLFFCHFLLHPELFLESRPSLFGCYNIYWIFCSCSFPLERRSLYLPSSWAVWGQTQVRRPCVSTATSTSSQPVLKTAGIQSLSSWWRKMVRRKPTLLHLGSNFHRAVLVESVKFTKWNQFSGSCWRRLVDKTRHVLGSVHGVM